MHDWCTFLMVICLALIIGGGGGKRMGRVGIWEQWRCESVFETVSMVIIHCILHASFSTVHVVYIWCFKQCFHWDYMKVKLRHFEFLTKLLRVYPWPWLAKITRTGCECIIAPVYTYMPALHHTMLLLCYSINTTLHWQDTYIHVYTLLLNTVLPRAHQYGATLGGAHTVHVHIYVQNVHALVHRHYTGT